MSIVTQPSKAAVLLCSVRDCRLPLRRGRLHLTCERGHSFDVARSGYINLLQPQERRSKQPGDTVAAAAGRRRLHDCGVTLPLLEAIAEMADAHAGEAVLDVGCGDGFYLGTLAGRVGIAGYGLDISAPSIDAAARRYPACEWIVANADRFVPYAGGSFSLVLSITARLNAAEFRRVLRDEGRLLVAVPAPGDLIELRGAGRDRVDRTVAEFAAEFSLVAQRRATTGALLDAALVQDALYSIYRPRTAGPVQEKRVTLSLDLLLFLPR
ncbi:MAG TPA: methyltransferase domain-containing protein [Bryobacteraceae bacterium]|nr:methyltransferase domain-containing protein [Bryobacteraceae bacterium]